MGRELVACVNMFKLFERLLNEYDKLMCHIRQNTIMQHHY